MLIEEIAGYKIPITVFLCSLIALLVLWSRNRATVVIDDTVQSNNKPVFLIIGPPNSGKTLLFQYLCTCDSRSKDHSTELELFTTKSFKMNIKLDLKLPYSGSTTSQHILVDIPGDEKIFNEKIREVTTRFRKITGAIFVVDACVSNNQLEPVARQLFTFLKLAEKRPQGIDTLLAMNKKDQFGARPANKLRLLLETEIQNLQKEHVYRMKGVAEDGKEDEEEEDVSWAKFSFVHLESNVEAIDGSVKKGDVQEWMNWIDHKVANPIF